MSEVKKAPDGLDGFIALCDDHKDEMLLETGRKLNLNFFSIKYKTLHSTSNVKCSVRFLIANALNPSSAISAQQKTAFLCLCVANFDCSQIVIKSYLRQQVTQIICPAIHDTNNTDHIIFDSINSNVF